MPWGGAMELAKGTISLLVFISCGSELYALKASQVKSSLSEVLY
jgi:hypothetical protein